MPVSYSSWEDDLSSVVNNNVANYNNNYNNYNNNNVANDNN